MGANNDRKSLHQSIAKEQRGFRFKLMIVVVARYITMFQTQGRSLKILIEMFSNRMLFDYADVPQKHNRKKGAGTEMMH